MQLLGELQFIANAMWPDIAFVINQLASYIANPSLQHMTALKRILWYLSETHEYEITYKNIPDATPKFKGYADAAFADREDFKSTTGYVFVAAGGVITWKSNKQLLMAQSSTKAKYITFWEAGKETLWLRNFYYKLGFEQNLPTLIFFDNTGAIEIAKNPLYHKRTKHMDIKLHWVWEKVKEGCFYPVKCHTTEQTANVLT